MGPRRVKWLFGMSIAWLIMLSSATLIALI